MLAFQAAMVALFIAWQYFKPLADVYFGSSSTVFFGSACAVAAFAVAAVRSSGNLSKYMRGMFGWATLMTGVGILSSFINDTPANYVYDLAFQTFSVAAICSAAEDVASNTNLLRWLIWVSVFFAGISAAIGIWGSMTGQTVLNVTREDVGVGELGFDSTTGRSGGLRGENYVGLWIAPATSMAIVRLSAGRLVLPLSLLILALSGVAVSLSRTAIISTLLLLVAGLAWHVVRRSVRNTILLVIGSALASSIIAALILTYGQWRSDYNVAQIVEDRFITADIKTARSEAWARGLDDFVASPILGKGCGASLPNEYNRYIYHNSILDIAGELGVVGLCIFLYPWWKAGKSLWSTRKWYRQSTELVIVTLSLVAMILSLMTLSNPFLKIVWIYLALLQGCLRGLTVTFPG